jgi:hypothetical protein
MGLTFLDGPSGESSPHPPIFFRVTDFRTTGVMNVFLLDPSERLLSAFVWVSTHNTIGSYALASVILHFSFYWFLNLKNLQKPIKTRKPGNLET